MTTIVTKNGSGAPLASDLVQGELAVDLTNKRLYTEDSGGTVIEVGTNPSTIDINAGTIDGTVIGGASAAAGTFTTFTSTGIDDNATSTAITIDSSENVGIGGSADPFSRFYGRMLGVSSASSSFLEINAATGNTSGIDFGVNSTRTAGITSNTTETNISTLGSTPLNFATNTSTRMTIDSSGSVGIGTASPNEKLVSNGAIRATGAATNIANADGALLDYAFGFARLTAGSAASSVGITFNTAVSGTPTERMRIDSSGNLLVGTTSSPNGGSSGVQVYNNTNRGRVDIGKTVTGTANAITNYHNGSYVGGVNYSDTATSFPTSSDVRLKENIVDAPAGNIDDIRVRSFDWKVDGSHQTYGVIAQELVDVAPEAVTQGETEDDVWGVDYSKLVPMMIKEIQDLKAEVAALKGA